MDIKNINLLEMFSYWSAPIEALKEEYRSEYEDEEFAWVPQYMIEDFTDADFQEFASDEFIEYMYELLGNRDYTGFIGFNYKTNWRNSIGYKMSKDLGDLLLFDFDYSLYLQDKGKDIVKLNMASHDVPTGADYYIIGITSEDDYYFLENEASFEEVQEFIEQYIRVFMSKEPEDSLLGEAVTNSASRFFDTGEEVTNEFSLNGWNVVSLDKLAMATTLVNKAIEKQGYKFIGNVGIYGGFHIPVADYDTLYDVVVDIVEEIIENQKAPRNQKSKKWDTSKWDKPRK